MIKILLNYRKSLLIILLGFSLITISGCDFSAKWDLRKAEKLLDEAVRLQADVSGDHKAKRAYFRAQEALEEGMYYARRRDINLARDKAQEAINYAEEAIAFATIYNDDIQSEKDALGAYKD